eukprot:365861-Chlamydomonas_euryale.AAC.24
MQRADGLSYGALMQRDAMRWWPVMACAVMLRFWLSPGALQPAPKPACGLRGPTFGDVTGLRVLPCVSYLVCPTLRVLPCCGCRLFEEAQRVGFPLLVKV